MKKVVFLLDFVLLHYLTVDGAQISTPTTQASDTATTDLVLQPVDLDSVVSQCRTCNQQCQPYNISQDGGLCKCDADCEVYGDCCGTSATRRPSACEGTVQDPRLNGLQFTCQSIFLNSDIIVMKHEAFWMVSTCSSDWISDIGESGETVLEGCISESRDLPPVTDIVTGIVYKNQHCALCNRVESSNTVAWEASIVCTPYLYQLLEITPISELNTSIFQEQCRPCSYQPPGSTRSPRACYPTEKSCLDELTMDTSISNCLNGSYNLQSEYSKRTTMTLVYRNPTCAKCNAATPTCLVEEFRGTNLVPNHCLPDSDDKNSRPVPLVPETILPPPDSQGIPFTITLSNLGGGQIHVKTETQSINTTVQCPEGQAPVGLDCRQTVCPENFISVDGLCFLQQLGVGKIDAANQSVNESGNGTFPTELVPLNDTEFTQVSNNTVLVNGVERKEVLGYNEDGQSLIYPDNITTVNKTLHIFSYPVGYLEIVYIGCSLSVIGSALVLITYGLFKELRTFGSKILMNLAFANLVTNLLILVGGPVSQTYSIAQLCTTVAILVHFFFLAQFSWMSVMSFEVVRKFHRARKLLGDSKRDKLHLLIAYILLGWGLPLFLTTVSIVVNFTTSGLVLYGVLADGSLGRCWINHLESIIIAFLVPLVLSISFNFVMFVIVTVYIIMASRSQAKLKKEDSTPFFCLNVAIFCTTGLTWIFGFIAILASRSWAWYIFIIFNCMQGFLIFVVFMLKKKTLSLYVNFLTCKMPQKKS